MCKWLWWLARYSGTDGWYTRNYQFIFCSRQQLTSPKQNPVDSTINDLLFDGKWAHWTQREPNVNRGSLHFYCFIVRLGVFDINFQRANCSITSFSLYWKCFISLLLNWVGVTQLFSNVISPAFVRLNCGCIVYDVHYFIQFLITGRILLN